MDVVEQRNWWQDGVTVSEAVISMDTVSRHIKRKMYIAQIQKYIHTYISIIREKRREVSMDIKQIKANKIRMILQFSIPSIIAMLLQTVITITDGYFTGNYVGQNALAAINLGLPILYFYLGTGLCIGVGGSVISGRMFGANELSSTICSPSLQ